MKFWLSLEHVRLQSNNKKKQRKKNIDTLLMGRFDWPAARHLLLNVSTCRKADRFALGNQYFNMAMAAVVVREASPSPLNKRLLHLNVSERSREGREPSPMHWEPLGIQAVDSCQD